MTNKNTRLAIAILARNCEKSLKKNFIELQKLEEYYSIDYYIIENDSTDGTKDFLIQWVNDDNHKKLISFNNLELPEEKQINGNRIQRMVQYRNLYMDAIEDSGVHYDYLVMVDIDVEYFSAEDIIDSINNKPEDAVGVFANGRYFYKIGKKYFLTNYYDLFAFEIENKKTNVDKLSVLNKKFKNNRFVTCSSAFAGIGIYEYKIIQKIRYKYEELDGNSICEHIPFNACACQHGKLYIDKQLHVRYEKISLIQYLKYVFVPIYIKKIFYREKL